MRAAEALSALTDAVNTHFPADVAAAITADEDFFARVATHAVRDLDAETSADIDALVAKVVADTKGHTLDWLVDTAESPTGWLHGRL